MNKNEPFPTEGDRAWEMGTILHSLYVAMGAATMLGEEDLIAKLKPVVAWYRGRTRDDLSATPYAP